MPFFFFASGLFFNPEKFETFGIFLKKKAKSLLLPYLVFSCLGILIMLVFPSWRILGGGKKWYVLRYVYYT